MVCVSTSTLVAVAPSWMYGLHPSLPAYLVFSIARYSTSRAHLFLLFFCCRCCCCFKHATGPFTTKRILSKRRLLRSCSRRRSFAESANAPATPNSQQQYGTKSSRQSITGCSTLPLNNPMLSKHEHEHKSYTYITVSVEMRLEREGRLYDGCGASQYR